MAAISCPALYLGNSTLASLSVPPAAPHVGQMLAQIAALASLHAGAASYPDCLGRRHLTSSFCLLFSGGKRLRAEDWPGDTCTLHSFYQGMRSDGLSGPAGTGCREI